MKAQDYPIAHFEFLTKVVAKLEALPAQLLEHQYHGESFGSWSFSARCKGVVTRFAFDGKEHSLYASSSRDRKPPYKFGSEVAVVLPSLSEVYSDAALERICEHLESPDLTAVGGAA